MIVNNPRSETDIFEDLTKLCMLPGFSHAIASFCFRDNMIGISDTLKSDHLYHTFSHNRLLRTEISTLIGLMVKAPLDLTLPNQSVLQDYLDRSEQLLQELHSAMSANVFDKIDEKLIADPNYNPFSLAHNLREPIFYGGESAYSFQYRDFTPTKYGRDNHWLLENKGFDISTAKKVVKSIINVQSRNLFRELQKLSEKPQSEWTLLPGFMFTAAEVAAECGISEKDIIPVLEAFALPTSDKNDRFNTVMDYNSTNSSPLIKIDERTYLLYQIYSIAEALYESPFYWMAADKAYSATALKHRGQFTEEITGEFLKRAFGSTHVFGNVTLPGIKGNILGEIDVLVLFGDRAVLVQAKSKRLTIEARKGNDLVLKDDFKKAIQNACDQAMLCAEIIMQPKQKLIDGSGKEIKVSTPIKEIFPICVVADHYPALNFQSRQFLKFNSLPNIKPPLISDIFALDALTEMLDSPLRLLSYFSLRSRAADRLMATHEHTLLGYHLKNNLWVESEYNLVMIEDNVAADLDAAMIVRREGILGDRIPEGILTRLRDTSLMRIVDEIESRQNPDIIDFGLFVLELDEDSVRSLSRALDQACAQTRADGRQHDATMTFGSRGITIHSNRLAFFEAQNLLDDHCRRRKYFHRADVWFGLSIDPYTCKVRFGITLKENWIADPAMDAVVANMPQGQKFRGNWPRGKVTLPGRNDPCHCGSGTKYKKCCLSSDVENGKRR
ncbi:prepilin peptidase [Methylobacterium sp. DB1607]|nr:prepilin peptidase [Methylobacterium sp. DB1607]